MDVNLMDWYDSDMYFVKRILITLATLVLTASFSPMAPASADTVAGCASSAVLKTNAWGITDYVSIPGYIAKFRYGSYSEYWFCPNGSYPNKVKVIGTNFCVTKVSGDIPWIQGFKWNPYYADESGKVVNPPQTEAYWHPVNWENGEQHCDRQNISTDIRKWMFMRDNPAWSLGGWVDISGWPDQEFHFVENDMSRHYIDPATDPILDPFGRIER